jgi:long-chain acyl-CoA synthetase
MHPRHWARVNPEKAAVIAARSGRVTTYRELNDRSMQCANLLHRAGLVPGDHVAAILENRPHFLEISWAAQRSGLYFTPISWRFQPDEVLYILEHCGAKALFVSHSQRLLAEQVFLKTRISIRLSIGGPLDGYQCLEQAMAEFPTTPAFEETRGVDMLYSSGSTGRPKAIKTSVGDPQVDGPPPLYRLFGERFGWNESTMYLMPAPLYHSGPLRFAMAMGYFGATVVLMEKFDARESLELCERYRITHAQWVPTMLVRLLKLPQEARRRYDLTHLKCVIHGAAPISVDVKRAMIDWLGPILEESYSATEGNGATLIGSNEWLAHPGSVGKAAFGTLHILDEAGEEVPVGTIGNIYFEGPRFEYYKEPQRTREAFNQRGWSTLGDIGYVDAEGYLYLTDRKSDVIITGGVNVYPIEAEHVLTSHPRVIDAAVFGVPDEDLGEAVHAVVQPLDNSDAGPELERLLLDYCRSRIAHYKCPRSIEFRGELPRHDTGKLYKRILKAQYIANAAERMQGG